MIQADSGSPARTWDNLFGIAQGLRLLRAYRDHQGHLFFEFERDVAIEIEPDFRQEELTVYGTAKGLPASVSCRWCNKQTVMVGVRECDACWDLRTKIKGANRDVLQRMMEALL